MADEIHEGVTYADLALGALRRYPDHVAFVHDGREISYAGASARVAQFARALAARGFGPGDGAVALSGNVPDHFFLMVAVATLGGHITALHPLGSPEDHAYIIEDSEATTFDFNPDLFDAHASEVAGRVDLPNVLAFGPSEAGIDLWAAADGESSEPVAPVARESDLVSLAYSSGTTGRPKGVIQPHRCAVEMTTMAMPGWQLPTSEFRFLAATPISHASIAFVLPALLNGGSIVLQPGFDPEAFCRAIEERRITTTFIVPTMLYVLLDHPAARQFDLSSLETVVYGAAPMSPARLAEGLETFGSVFVQLYGQAEAPATVTALRKEEHDTARPHLLASCGQPLPGVHVEVHDDDDQVVGAGEVGEICVRGRLVSDGYWKLPEQTAETFRNGWLHTGDMARRDDEGYLYIVDRKKDMVITGGMNVFPREVEDVLTAHPDVAMAAVIGVPDDRWGEALKALVVTRPGAQVGADDLIALVRERKGSVFAPKTVDFVASIPLTGIGKPDKKAIRAQFWGAEARAVH